MEYADRRSYSVWSYGKTLITVSTTATGVCQIYIPSVNYPTLLSDWRRFLEGGAFCFHDALSI